VTKMDDSETADRYDTEITFIRADLKRLRVQPNWLYPPRIQEKAGTEDSRGGSKAPRQQRCSRPLRCPHRPLRFVRRLYRRHPKSRLRHYGSDQSAPAVESKSGIHRVQSALCVDVIDHDGTVVSHSDGVGLVLLVRIPTMSADDPGAEVGHPFRLMSAGGGERLCGTPIQCTRSRLWSLWTT